MKNSEIAEFLQDFRVQMQTVMDEKMRPVYRNNTWLKQKDLIATERVLMQLIDEINADFTIAQLQKLTGFSKKCIRENLRTLAARGFVSKGDGHAWKTRRMF